ncbi:TetR/AcrR family transcriptional regulator [Gordonia neofelifaecis]|uniref:Regulatory protein TetR n=1 Tax=Gordonia neofelifaecis NRRL B-59395 TaxID=644548 RepID=F1YFV8_9ACTN|nr:TetR/AcrR family transcriptional regulator [Gordonia neofelifaecis]EGD56535.1 regulatory protein TetR [Gordonia neofelifaecis NRRL B-59395]
MASTTALDGTTVRGRLLEAMLVCLDERGYRATTIADIVRAARTSKRSFYEQFTDKQECYLELLGSVNHELLAAIEAAVDQGAPWREQVRQAVHAYIAVCESHPSITRSWIRELPALGDVARAVQLASLESFTELMARLTSTEQFRAARIEPIARETAVIIWGGIRELAASTLEDGRPLRTLEESAVAACLALTAAGRST